MHSLKIGALFLLSSLLLSATCERQKSNEVTTEDEISQHGTLPPVENRDPNTDYEPAFEGQTRIGGVKTTTPYEVTVIAEGLNKPWAVTALPDGRLLITQKAGSLRIATSNGTLSEPITGFPEVDDRGQGGLLDVAPAPDFESSRMLYFSLAERTPQGSLTAIGKDSRTIV